MTFWIYILPLPLFALIWAAWIARTSCHWFAGYVMILPLLYGYIAPGIATNVLKKWRFTGPGRMGRYFIHHGFIYAAHMSTCLFVVFGSTSSGFCIDLTRGLAIVIATGALYGFAQWIHDIYMLRSGIVKIDSPLARAGQSAEEVAFGYAPLCFFALGLTYATGCVMAYNEFVVRANDNWPTMAWLLSAGLAMMLLLPSLAFGIVEKRSLTTGRGRNGCR